MGGARGRRSGDDYGLAVSAEEAWLERAGESEGAGCRPACQLSRSGEGTPQAGVVEERRAGGAFPNSAPAVSRASSTPLPFLPSPALQPRVSGGERREGTKEEAKAE